MYLLGTLPKGVVMSLKDFSSLQLQLMDLIYFH